MTNGRPMAAWYPSYRGAVVSKISSSRRSSRGRVRARMGRVFGPEATMVSIPIPSEPRVRAVRALPSKFSGGSYIAFSCSLADRVEGSLDTGLGNLIGIANDRPLCRSLDSPQIGHQVFGINQLDAITRRLHLGKSLPQRLVNFDWH